VFVDVDVGMLNGGRRKELLTRVRPLLVLLCCADRAIIIDATPKAFTGVFISAAF
jgi:hypothetical protein